MSHSMYKDKKGTNLNLSVKTKQNCSAARGSAGNKGKIDSWQGV